LKAGIKKVDLCCFGFSEVNVSIALFKNTENKSITSIIMIKDKNKEVYTSPITEALELRFEGNLLSGSEFFTGGAGTYSEVNGEINWNGDF